MIQAETSIKMTNYTSLADQSKVWIYQASRPFLEQELVTVEHYLQQFVENWVSHNRALKSFGKVYHHQFIVLMVDETQAGASGCSIDSSVHFLQQLGTHFQVNLFDRMTFAYQENGEIKTAHRDQFIELFQQGSISEQTLVFDNLVATKQDFDQQWLKPLGKNWHWKILNH